MGKAEEEKAGSFVNVIDVENRLEKKEWHYSIAQDRSIWKQWVFGFLLKIGVFIFPKEEMRTSNE